MAEAQETTRESISSVELSRNAKGGTQVKVKVYNDNPEDAQATAEKVYTDLCKKYPQA